MKTLVHLLLSGIAVLLSARLLSGVTVDSFMTAVLVAIVLGIINVVLTPALVLLTLPINIMTLGLFTFVIMGFVAKLTSVVVPGFHLANFWWAMGFGLLFTCINSFFYSLERKNP